jgi:hypothetical protein
MHYVIDRRASRRRFGNLNLKVVGCVGAGLFLLLCVVGVAGGGYYYFWYKPQADKVAKEAERQRILDVLKPELSSYLDIKTTNATTKKFKGKVVCIDKSKKEIDADSLTELPDALRATKPEEVGAVAWLVWKEEEGGTYPDGSKAKIHVVDLMLIEKQTGTRLIFKQIRGDTQAEKYGEGDRVGPKPWDKIAAVLQEFADAN